MIYRYGDYDREATFDADVVVIGTGAGGAVVGTELAEAGHSVIFVEEGSYIPTSSFSPWATETIPRLYRDASSTAILGRAPIPYLEGRCVGGSTVLNGGMTWRAPERVHARWEVEVAPELSYKAMEPLYQRVEARISAKPQNPQSVGDDNRIMVQGGRKMGWHVDLNKRNQDHCVGTNNCVFGCPTGAKRSTLVSYLPSAFAHGARCLTEVRVEKLLIEGGRCVGVVGRAVDPHSRKKTVTVTLRARVVVVACGAIHTPHLLSAHRLGRPSELLGRNFTCHPNAKVAAIYPFDIKGWQGVSQFSKIMEFHGDGIMIAENFIPPGGIAAHLPAHGAKAWELMTRYNQMVLSGFMLEDSTTGTVSRGPFDMPISRYELTAYDHRRLIRATRLLAEMHFSMGAEKVLLPFANHHEATSMDDLKNVDEKRHPIDVCELFTVHMMGTARMGARPESSVVDLGGQVWDLPGCFVADASLFPTAIGVNPQVTIMAMASKVAQRVLDEIRVWRVATRTTVEPVNAASFGRPAT